MHYGRDSGKAEWLQVHKHDKHEHQDSNMINFLVFMNNNLDGYTTLRLTSTRLVFLPIPLSKLARELFRLSLC